jgi:hypothetical protein
VLESSQAADEREPGCAIRVGASGPWRALILPRVVANLNPKVIQARLGHATITETI